MHVLEEGQLALDSLSRESGQPALSLNHPSLNQQPGFITLSVMAKTVLLCFVFYPLKATPKSQPPQTCLFLFSVRTFSLTLPLFSQAS